ncbi:hypothetical protein [Deinococcus cellulosilyticus]|uniref:Uncharacterized protein n=1 Tax=Deinococcus cellulosilyticus (strain DSM 18568 / NBRC 106333 / KACC 11606 / 5516J-15) TaxID=1223518 RepID=A0A511MW03_DEIC1|nr:hypothetical protein [Deinococcus cellulosilyticus]GEM44759.1 hypothetical protein DC3_03940 [Deinococcus cellulosilyticus NBRC 106333 = KACC 11606]
MSTIHPAHDHSLRVLETFKIRARKATIIEARKDSARALAVLPGMSVQGADGHVWRITGVVWHALPPDEVHLMVADAPERPVQQDEILWVITE